MQSKKVISAGMFLKAFANEWARRQAETTSEMDLAYGDSTGWTQLMKGENGILAAVMRTLCEETGLELKLRNEWYTVDALYIESADSGVDNAAYPFRIHALIEHENRDDVEVEMWKLIFWRAPLKVIIFYDWNETDKVHHRSQQPLKNRVNWLQNKIDFLCEMHELANDFHTENEATEYLFIVGNRDNQELLRWRWASPQQRIPLEVG